jgi:hypothetical protein
MQNEICAGLLSHYAIYLMGDDTSRMGQFASIFRKTWKQLPLGTRRALLRYWRAGHQEFQARCEQAAGRALSSVELRFPFIQLSNDWPGRAAGDLGTCSGPGWELNFHAGVFEIMPDCIASAVIAHELCHAFFCAQARDFASIEAEEGEVESCIAAWGFDVASLDKWLRTTRAARKAAGVYRCGWCDERDIPSADAPTLPGLTGPEPVCLECAAQEG